MEQISVFDYFRETEFLINRITNLEKRVLTEGKELLQNSLDGEFEIVKNVGVLKGVCSSYWILLKNIEEFLDFSNRFVFLRVGDGICKCFNCINNHDEIYRFLIKVEKNKISDLSNDTVCTYFLRKLNKYLQVGIYQTSTSSIDHPITDEDLLNYELKAAVIYDTMDEAASGFTIYDE